VSAAVSEPTSPPTTQVAAEIAVPWWKYTRALAPAVAFWLILIGSLAYLLWARGKVGPENDDATVREWLDEARVWRKSLPELVRDYLTKFNDFGGDPEASQVREKREEIAEQIEAMADPLRAFPNQLPMFPEVFRLEIEFPGQPDAIRPIVWDSPVPRPRRQNQSRVRHLQHHVYEGSAHVAVIRCEYRLHAFNKLQRDEAQRQTILWVVGGVTLGGSLLAFIWVYLFLRRERSREVRQLKAEQAREHAEVLMLAAKIEAQEAERTAEETNRKLLEQRVDAAKAEARAAEAERTNLEMKSQLYASIGIMAGSYAHNIKNLLVRPNDLLNRCLESDRVSPEQSTMLHEVKSTLGTVTERLQEILRTIRRDPTKGEDSEVDLNLLVMSAIETWRDIARDKWKMTLHGITSPQPLSIRGDLSHLQQAIENLIFNARDATFEMRNHQRDAARGVADPAKRKQAIIDAASWKGEVTIRAASAAEVDAEQAILEVSDNGIGMTPEVRAKCLETHFTTKRDNALYEGLSAGMGLGLSFVAMVLEHHHATLEIETGPGRGAAFRMSFPVPD
jgi:signal transduction histidine kinase